MATTELEEKQPCFAEITVDELFVAGDTYIVTWDGTDYECRGKSLMIDRYGDNFDVFVGSEEIYYGIKPPNEPFLMRSYHYEEIPKSRSGDETISENRLIIATFEESETHTVSIRHVNVVKKVMDESCLPAIYQGKNSISFLDMMITFGMELGMRLTRTPVEIEDSELDDSLVSEGVISK